MEASECVQKPTVAQEEGREVASFGGGEPGRLMQASGAVDVHVFMGDVQVPHEHQWFGDTGHERGKAGVPVENTVRVSAGARIGHVAVDDTKPSKVRDLDASFVGEW
jgi:hypothetical protein